MTDSPLITDEHIRLVEESWALVLPIQDTAAELFYGRLFEVAPELKALFSSDMKEQGRKLMKMISVAVSGLRKLDSIVPAVQDLGRRHGGYGVKSEDYAVVGSSLIWTLQQGLGEAFSPEVEKAWLSTYSILSSTMIEAAEESETAGAL